jgi:hypothetical protein
MDSRQLFRQYDELHEYQMGLIARARAVVVAAAEQGRELNFEEEVALERVDQTIDLLADQKRAVVARLPRCSSCGQTKPRPK